MIQHLKKHNTLWLVVACLSLIAALIGVLDQQIYNNVVRLVRQSFLCWNGVRFDFAEIAVYGQGGVVSTR